MKKIPSVKAVIGFKRVIVKNVLIVEKNIVTHGQIKVKKEWLIA